MNPEHPRWREFLELVDEGLDPQFDADGNLKAWTMSGDFSLAIAACRKLGLSSDEILDSVEYWKAHGAFNDDEIMVNLS